MNKWQRKAKKEAFYQRGAAAIMLYHQREVYCCPICGNGFDRTVLTNGELTLEHAPAASVGGKPIALTCRKCNSISGHSIDSSLSQRERLTAFTETLLGNRRDDGVRASIQIGEERLATRFYQDEHGTRNLVVLGSANDPSAVERTMRYLDGLTRTKTWDGEQFRITSHASYNHRLALIADLKAAFIIAFAALGYRYAFNSRLRCVREQILNPKEQLIDGWNTQLDSAHLPEFVLLFVESIPGIIVKMGKSSVILPWVSGPHNLYEDLASRYKRGDKIEVNGKLLCWPNSLEMAFDFWNRTTTSKTEKN
jgi:hypothetical protein